MCPKSTLRSLIFCLASLATGFIAAAEATPQFLSDALADRINSSQDWGKLGFNTAVQPASRTAAKLRIKDQQYQHGLGHHANGEITVALEGLYQTFECEVGLQWQGGHTQGSVVFQAYVDDKKVFDSGVMRENDAARKLRLPVENADVLRLVVTDAGDGIACDCADWAEARLTPDPAAKKRIAETAVDIAPFARVVTSDAKRMTGTAATRVQQFPAADIVLETDVKPAGDGGYAVPVTADAPGCIGLRWYEMRSLRRLGLHWANGGEPSIDTVQLQYWVGISPWQGGWKPLVAKLERAPGVWNWEIAHRDQPEGTYRVRWVFAAAKRPITLTKIAAFSRSAWATANLRVELQHDTVLTLALSRRERGSRHLPSPVSGRGAGGEGGESEVATSNALTLTLSQRERGSAPARIVVTNGNFVGAAGQENALIREWNTAQPLGLKVRYSKPRPHKGDRTVLRFELPAQPISVAVEDVLSHGCVYVPSAGCS